MRYEKGRKQASRQKILEVAAERFRAEGIAATGLATIMSDEFFNVYDKTGPGQMNYKP